MEKAIPDRQVDLDPACYAPYASPRRFITDWTDKIWITRGIGRLGDHYAPDIKVHTCYGETYGFDDVIGNSLQKMVAFPNRGGGHDDVIWEARGPSSFVSSHRVFNNATHLGHWTYGPPTGKEWVNRGIAHCLIVDGKVTEEWVIRDEYAVLEHLGLDPFEIARQLTVRSPVLGAEIGSLDNAPALSGTVADPVATGISGVRPARFERECARVREMFEDVWNRRLFDAVGDYFDDTIVCQTVRLRRVMNIAPYQLEVMKLLAAFPDAKIEVRDIVANYSDDLGLRIAVIWLLRGTYSGSPIYGPVNRAPVRILGASHFELRGDKIIREWRIYDEIAVMAQILKAETPAA